MKEKMGKILISIVIPVYNVESFIDRCIESIIHYPENDIEIILVDDGSSDTSRTLCKKWMEKDSRIYLTPPKSNGGLADARNYGMTFCNGQWILFIDSDDYLQRDAIKILKEIVMDCDVDESIIVFNYYNVINQNKTIAFDLQDEQMTGKIACERMLMGNLPVSAWSKMVRRNFYLENNIVFPVGRRYEDTIVTWRLYKNAKKIKMIQVALYNYVQQSESITANPVEKDAADVIQNLKEIKIDISEESGFYIWYCNYCCRALVYAYQIYVMADGRNKEIEMQIKKMFKKFYNKADAKWLKKQEDYRKILLMRCGCLKMVLKLRGRLLEWKK